MKDKEIALESLKKLCNDRIAQQVEKYADNTNNDVVNNQILIMHSLQAVILMLEELRLHQQFDLRKLPL